MPYLIDGHNLIPYIPDLSLQDLDDEIQLVKLLQSFCQQTRKQVEVFFDKSSPGQRKIQIFGQVTARFVRENSSADQAIFQRLRQLGRQARNWTVVSSDRMVQLQAKALHAKVLPSDQFAHFLSDKINKSNKYKHDDGLKEHIQSDAELQEWLELFKDTPDDR